MARQNILFLHHRQNIFNLGDFLCTPFHYFDFLCNRYENASSLKDKSYKIILGGGVFNDLGLSKITDYQNTVCWGIGSSTLGYNTKPVLGFNLPYFLYGLRDPDAVDSPEKILPCVSCLHPMVQLALGSQTNLFLNYDRRVTDLDIFRDFFPHPHVKRIVTNNTSEYQFMRMFAKTKRIITNSYHAGYWGLLSGREVAIIGYSSKFRSLVKLFGLDERNVEFYSILDRGMLKNKIVDIIKQDKFMKVKNCVDIRNEFIRKNISFAKQCLEKGFIEKFALRHNNLWSIINRDLKNRFYRECAGRKRK